MYSRICGENMTNGDVVMTHAVLVALGIGAIAVENLPVLSFIAIAVAGVVVWWHKKR